MSELLAINVNDRTEKKGQLTYLSWAWAWAEVLKYDPQATWVAHNYGPEGSVQPCMWIGDTAMVHTSVIIKGLRRECMLPVMDHKNNAVKNPDSRKISDAIMRCMTKAISMHGLGLYIYAGEDLPQSGEPAAEPLAEALEASVSMPRARMGVMAAVLKDMPELSSEDSMYFKELAASVEDLIAAQGPGVAFDRVQAEGLDADQLLHLWSLLNSKVRSALKAEKKSRMATVAA